MKKFDELVHDLSNSIQHNTLYVLDIHWEFQSHTWLPLRDNTIIAYLYDPESETFQLVNAVTWLPVTCHDFYADYDDDIKGYSFSIDESYYLLNHTICLDIWGDNFDR